MQAATAAAAGPVGRRSGYVCECLEITEAALIETLSQPQIRTIRDLRRTIGAGDGCMACHDVLRQYLRVARQAPCPPI